MLLIKLVFILLSLSSLASVMATEKMVIVKKNETLRIGTTFDYPPFSYKNSHGKIEGIDVELARAFAKSQGLTPVFIKTSWKTLSQDLTSDKFDFALSGISRTKKRLSEAHQGIGYINNGKMGISKCSDAHLYPDIKSINNPKTKAVTNPGGTNEAFAKENLERTALIIHQDNKTIFNEIIQGRADIMITDSVEVRYQVKNHQGVLCPTMKTPLTFGVITYFAQVTKGLKVKLDAWFKLINKNGLKKRIIKKYL